MSLFMMGAMQADKDYTESGVNLNPYKKGSELWQGYERRMAEIYLEWMGVR